MISTEALKFFLASAIGKHDAHALVYEASMEAVETDTPMLDILMKYPAVADNFTRDEIQERFEELSEGKNIVDQDWTCYTDDFQKQLLRDKRSKAIALYLDELKTSLFIDKNSKPIHDFYDQYRVGKAETNDNNMNE